MAGILTAGENVANGVRANVLGFWEDGRPVMPALVAFGQSTPLLRFLGPDSRLWQDTQGRLPGASLSGPVGTGAVVERSTHIIRVAPHVLDALIIEAARAELAETDLKWCCAVPLYAGLPGPHTIATDRRRTANDYFGSLRFRDITVKEDGTIIAKGPFIGVVTSSHNDPRTASAQARRIAGGVRYNDKEEVADDTEEAFRDFSRLAAWRLMGSKHGTDSYGVHRSPDSRRDADGSHVNGA